MRSSLAVSHNTVYVILLWASLVSQLAKNPPAMWKTWVRSLVGKKGKAKHSSILVWRIPVFWSGDSMRSSPAVSHNTVHVILYLLTKYVILSMCLLTSCLLFLSLEFNFFNLYSEKKKENLSYLEANRK